MASQYYEQNCLKKNLQRAYIMGLESAVVVLEKSLKLSHEGQKEMLKCLSEMIQREKAENAMLD